MPKIRTERLHECKQKIREKKQYKAKKIKNISKKKDDKI